jgi:hypothetical protein
MARSVSVVIPTYNRAEFLPATLDAVLAQTSPPTEIIVVDDGSTDDTASVLRAYAPRVTSRRIRNGGDLVARNAGLAVAQGELVAFCDSDDIWRPDMLARMQALWQAEPGLRAGFTNFQILRAGTWQPGDKFADAPTDYWAGLRSLGDGLAVFDAPIIERLIQFQPCFPSCLVVETAFLRGIGGWDESVGRIVGSDFATILRIGEYAPIGVVQQPMVGIRKHSANYSGDVQAMNLGDAAVLEHVLARRTSLQGLSDPITRSMAARRAQALDTAFSRQDFEAVRRIYALLPPQGRGGLRFVKHAVAKLPQPMGRVAGRALLALGSLRNRGSPVAGPESLNEARAVAVARDRRR